LEINLATKALRGESGFGWGYAGTRGGAMDNQYRIMNKEFRISRFEEMGKGFLRKRAGESIRRITTNPFDKPAAAGKLRTSWRGFSTGPMFRSL